MRPRCVSIACLLFWISFCYGRVLLTDADALIPGANRGRCSLPPETGPCRAAFRRWYFNSTVNECVEFVYGGCEGNENNFETKENCNTTCNVSAVPHQALADDPVEKTIRTYMKLVKNGVQPEEPVPFFSKHEMFRRSTQTQSSPGKRKLVKRKGDAAAMDMSAHDLEPYFTGGNLETPLRHKRSDNKTGAGASSQQVLIRNSSDKRRILNNTNTRASKSGLRTSGAPSLGGPEKTTTISSSELQSTSSPRIHLTDVKKVSSEQQRGSSDPDKLKVDLGEIGSKSDSQSSSVDNSTSSDGGNDQVSNTVEKESKSDSQSSSVDNSTSSDDGNDQGSDSVEKESKSDSQSSPVDNSSSSDVGDGQGSNSVEKESKSDSQSSSVDNSTSSDDGNDQGSDTVEKESKSASESSPVDNSSPSDDVDGQGSDSVEKGSKSDSQSSVPKYASSGNGDDQRSDSVEKGSKSDSQSSVPKYASSGNGDDQRSDSVEKGSKSDSQSSSGYKPMLSYKGDDQRSNSVEKEAKAGSHSLSGEVVQEQEGESGRRRPDSQIKKHSSQEQKEFSDRGDKEHGDESFEEDDYDSSNTQTYRKDSSIYRGSDPLEHTSSHFAAFFLTSIVMVFAAYVIYHNRQKIIAIIIEGRNDSSRRRGYRKLETNVEEAMPSMQKSANSTYVY